MLFSDIKYKLTSAEIDIGWFTALDDLSLDLCTNMGLELKIPLTLLFSEEEFEKIKNLEDLSDIVLTSNVAMYWPKLDFSFDLGLFLMNNQGIY